MGLVMENKFTRFSVSLIFFLLALISYGYAFRLIDTTVWWIPISVYILIKIGELMQDFSASIWAGRNTKPEVKKEKLDDSDEV